MTKKKPKTKTIEASELRKGDLIKIGPDSYTSVLETGHTGDLVSVRHRRTRTPRRIERGMFLMLCKTERVEVLAELES